MLQRGRQHDLALEAVDGNAGCQIVRQHLDDDLTPKRIVGGHEDDRHATTTKLPLDGVARAESSLQIFANVSH